MHPAHRATPHSSSCRAAGAAALLAGAVLLLAPDAAAAGLRTGSLEGEVNLGPDMLERRMRFNVYPDLRRGTPGAGSSPASETENVVIYLEGPAPFPAAARTYTMAQQDGVFAPHVLPVPVGSTVEFPNQDRVYHNVFSLSKAESFDLGRYPRGSSRSVRFDTAGVVKVFCHIHSDMSAVVLVVPNPFFAQPDANGRFRIDGIPAGEYTVVAWHERARRVAATVQILDDATTSLRFDIPLQEPEGGGR
jgi:plastocyanin